MKSQSESYRNKTESKKLHDLFKIGKLGRKVFNLLKQKTWIASPSWWLRSKNVHIKQGGISELIITNHVMHVQVDHKRCIIKVCSKVYNK